MFSVTLHNGLLIHVDALSFDKDGDYFKFIDRNHKWVFMAYLPISIERIKKDSAGGVGLTEDLTATLQKSA